MSPLSQQIQQTKERNPEMQTTLILLLAPSNLLIVLSMVLMALSSMFFRRAIFLNIGFAALSTACAATVASLYPYNPAIFSTVYYAAGCVVGSILLNNKTLFIIMSFLFYILCFIALFS